MLWKKVMPRPLGRPRAVGRDAARRRARARADALRRRRVLGRRRHASTRARFEARLVAVDGTPGRAGPRLRPGRPARRERSSCWTRSAPAGSPSELDGRAVRRALGRGEALHAPARARRSGRRRCSRRRAASCASPRRRRCASPSGCTRTATSPTCAPTRRRCPSPPSPPRARRRRELYGAETVPDAAAIVRARGEERAGGARGDPPGGRHVPHADSRSRRAVARRARALRADLEADDRLADGGRARPDGQDPARRDHGGGRGRRVPRRRHGDHVPRLPARLRGGPRRARPTTRRSAGCRSSRSANASSATTLEPEGHETTPARALHGGDPGQGARGPRHRPPVDVRLDHRARSSTAATCSRRERRSCRRSSPSRSRSCSRGTSGGSSTTTSPRAWRTTSTGSPPGSEAARRAGCSASTSATATPGPARARHRPPRRDRRARGQLDRRSRAATSSCASAATGPYLERGEERASVPDDIAPDELTAATGRGAAREAVRRPRRSASIPRPGARSSSRTAATGRT